MEISITDASPFSCEERARLVQVIYFLSRQGKIEQPHLMKVCHLQPKDVHLKDVKKWLSELRGTSMPEEYSWSYKRFHSGKLCSNSRLSGVVTFHRKYKHGYVWQDLRDEDVIVPIGDDEYVLKGSELCASSSDEIKEGKFEDERRNERRKEIYGTAVGNQKETITFCPRPSTLAKSSSEIFETSPFSSSDGSSLTDEIKQETLQVKDLNKPAQEDQHRYFYGAFMDEATRGRDTDKVVIKYEKNAKNLSTALFPKGSQNLIFVRSYNLLKNIFNCNSASASDNPLTKVKKSNVSKRGNIYMNSMLGGVATTRKLQQNVANPRGRLREGSNLVGNTKMTAADSKPVAPPTLSLS